MELVYLWVEEYKNIHKQGFNFSPRFECSRKDRKIIIKNNSDKVSTFFNENIKITAIVGENGSGKSTLLNAILDDSKTNQNSGRQICLYRQGTKWIVYLYRYQKNKQDKWIYQKCYKEYEDNEEIILQSKDFKKCEENSKENYKNIFYKSIIDDENNFITGSNHINLSASFELNRGLYIYQSQNVQHIVSLLKKEKIELMFDIPKYLYFEIDENNYIFQEFRDLKYKKNGNYEDYFIMAYYNAKCTQKLYLYLIFSFFYKNKEMKKKFKEMDYLDNNDGENKSTIEQIIKFYEDYSMFKLKKNNDLQYVKNELDKFELLDEKSCSFRIKISDLNKNFIEKYHQLIYDNNGKDEQPSNQSFLKFSYGEKRLSSGQYHFLLLFSKLLYAIESTDTKEFIVFIDEGELTLHPNWQKKYINYLYNFFKDNFSSEYKIHLILTTHSPFIISDLPKQNVIFLDKYEEEDEAVKNGEQKIGNCKVLSHDEVLSKKQTFGANIHTLLSDSFFMEDGLMGEFARGKITEIKEFYEKVVEENKKKESDFTSLRKEYEENQIKFEHIQSIIGEPFLKTVIKNYLDEIEDILFEDKAKEMAIERIIREYGIEDIEKGLKNVKS